MMGPGKYDCFATDVREQTKAQGVVLIVVNGVLGSWFSMQADEKNTRALPDMLEAMARQIRADIAASDKLDIRKAP